MGGRNYEIVRGFHEVVLEIGFQVFVIHIEENGRNVLGGILVELEEVLHVIFEVKEEVVGEALEMSEQRGYLPLRA